MPTAYGTELVTALSALIASFLSGLLGIGGGVVLTPLLLYLPPAIGIGALPVKIITGLTIVQAISGSVLGAFRHRAYGNVSARLVLTMGPTGAICGKKSGACSLCAAITMTSTTTTPPSRKSSSCGLSGQSCSAIR